MDETQPFILNAESKLQEGEYYYNGNKVKPIYGYRFKGTNEYAAYRWECVENAGERYYSIKIKALPVEESVALEEIADEDFWAIPEDNIELKFPVSGYQNNSGNIINFNQNGYCWSSTFDTIENSSNETEGPAFFAFQLATINDGEDNSNRKFPIRLVANE